MKDFSGKIAVVTGGGTGMGRALARQLAAEGCSVAICDIMADSMAETKALCEADAARGGARITAHRVDISKEEDMLRFRDEVAKQMDTSSIHLLFNNAGVAGGGSLFTDSREAWERTFNINWYGVYYGVRTFLPMLVSADEAHIVNTSSINGFWATIDPGIPHTAYCAAKFAVKGFTEALLTDLAVNAPHVKCSVVMPGHIGTDIVGNSRKILQGVSSDTLTQDEIGRMRARLKALGQDEKTLTDEAIQAMSDASAQLVAETAPTSAAEAARIMLDGVRNNRWRILLGEDAEELDRQVRLDPEGAYTKEFFSSYAPLYARKGYNESAW